MSCSTREVADRIGCTYRQLDYWCRMGWIPGQEVAEGSGRHRVFSPEQVKVAARIQKAMALASATLEERLAVIEQLELAAS